MLDSILIISISIIISIVQIFYIIIHRENYRPSIIIFFLILSSLLNGIFYSTTFNLSIEGDINKDFALSLWKTSIVVGILSFGTLNMLEMLILEYNKIRYGIAFIYAFVNGLIISILYDPNSIVVIQAGNIYYYVFQNVNLLILIIFFCIAIVLLMWYIGIKNYSKIRNKELKPILSLFLISYSFYILVYIGYITTNFFFFRTLHLFCLIINGIFSLYIIISKPNFFTILDNKIYDFIIFHKSGILLYSFSFETGKETEESLLKGSILIGINHILNSLIDKKDQLTLIKMKERDIIFEYNNELGIAILLITNYKNIVIEKAVKNFMDKFIEENKEKLYNLNGLIDISEFRDTKDIIKEYFSPFIVSNNI